jgi:hypothetical protein
MVAYCDDGKSQDTRKGLEGYVTPGFPMKYRIHSLLLKNIGDINLQVRNILVLSTLKTEFFFYEYVSSE